MYLITSTRRLGVFFFLVSLFTGCNNAQENEGNASTSAPAPDPAPVINIAEPRPDVYAEFSLVADLSRFSDDQRRMIGLLIEASQIMDDLFWRQAYGDDYQRWLAGIGVDSTRRFADALVNWVQPAYANRHVIIRNDSEIRRISLEANPQ